MESTLGNPSSIGMATVNSVDIFQAGREAAQMAKRQLSDHHRMNIVLAFGPDTIHFQDFIEGVRLVTGEERLIGLPNRTSSSNSVLIASSATNQFELACCEIQPNKQVSTTTLLSQFRRARGNNRHQFEYHGILCFGSTDAVKELSADVGLDSWIVSVKPSISTKLPLICRDTAIERGVVALECCTNQGIGIGMVNIAAFSNEERVFHEAAQLATKEALNQLPGSDPSFGFLFVHESIAEKISDQKLSIGQFPYVVIPTQSQWCRPIRRTVINADHAMVAVVVPQ